MSQTYDEWRASRDPLEYVAELECQHCGETHRDMESQIECAEKTIEEQRALLFRVLAAQGSGHVWQMESVCGDVRDHLEPKQIELGSCTIKAPYRGELEMGQEYYVVQPSFGNGCTKSRWTNEDTERKVRDLGLLHLTMEGAQAHSQAILSLTRRTT